MSPLSLCIRRGRFRRGTARIARRLQLARCGRERGVGVFHRAGGVRRLDGQVRSLAGASGGTAGGDWCPTHAAGTRLCDGMFRPCAAERALQCSHPHVRCSPPSALQPWPPCQHPVHRVQAHRTGAGHQRRHILDAGKLAGGGGGVESRGAALAQPCVHACATCRHADSPRWLPLSARRCLATPSARAAHEAPPAEVPSAAAATLAWPQLAPAHCNPVRSCAPPLRTPASPPPRPPPPASSFECPRCRSFPIPSTIYIRFASF